jgi:hypothetical protein
MSIRAVTWALNDAPVEEPVQVLILVAMAEKANDDGTVTYQSAKTIGTKARVSPRTVQRELKKLEEAGIIRRGDQRHVEHIRADRRPVVYDLAVHLRRGDNLTHRDDPDDTTPEQPRYDTEAPRYDMENIDDTTRMSHNTSLDSSLLNTSIETPALFEGTVEDDPPKGDVKDSPPDIIAKVLYEEMRGAMKYMALRQLAQWAIEQWPERDWTDIGRAMRTLHRSPGGITRLSIQRLLDGIIIPGVRQPQARVPLSEINARQNDQLRNEIRNQMGELTS